MPQQTQLQASLKLKTCARCKEELPVEMFTINRRQKDGRCIHCKTCVKLFNAGGHATHRIARNNRRREAWAKNPEKGRAENRKAYAKHRDKRINDARRRYYGPKHETIKEQSRQYQRQPKVKQKRRIQSRQRHSVRMQTDPVYKIKRNLRFRVREALIGKRKVDSTEKLTGCSMQFLKEHLENSFVKGMSWENYGKWEIDHIIPCASFDLSNPSEQYTCFHWSNLQPLWAIDNRRKGAKVI